MQLLLVVVIVLSVALFIVCAAMTWLGLLSLVARAPSSRYVECGHRREMPVDSPYRLCWRCRHQHLMHLLALPTQRLRHTH